MKKFSALLFLFFSVPSLAQQVETLTGETCELNYTSSGKTMIDLLGSRPNSYELTWSGTCLDGYAHGPGLLLARTKSQASATVYTLNVEKGSIQNFLNLRNATTALGNKNEHMRVPNGKIPGERVSGIPDYLKLSIAGRPSGEVLAAASAELAQELSSLPSAPQRPEGGSGQGPLSAGPSEGFVFRLVNDPREGVLIVTSGGPCATATAGAYDATAGATHLFMSRTLNKWTDQIWGYNIKVIGTDSSNGSKRIANINSRENWTYQQQELNRQKREMTSRGSNVSTYTRNGWAFLGCIATNHQKYETAYKNWVDQNLGICPAPRSLEDGEALTACLSSKASAM